MHFRTYSPRRFHRCEREHANDERHTTTTRIFQKWLRTRRGAIVVLAALMMIVFLASVAFSVDVAYMQLTKIKLRSATDAAARAAGEGLSRAQDTDYARQAAKDIAAANLVAGEPLLFDDSTSSSANPPAGRRPWAFTPSGQPINAVRVNGRRTRDAPSGSVPIFFGRVFNVFDFQPVQAATVVRLDRDICLVVDRSSSMKLYLTDTARRCRPATRASASRRTWPRAAGAPSPWPSSASSMPWTPRRNPSTSAWSPTAATIPPAASPTIPPTSTIAHRNHNAVTLRHGNSLRQEIQRHDQHRRRHHPRHSGADSHRPDPMPPKRWS